MTTSPAVPLKDASAPPAASPSTRTLVASSLVGTTIEYFDFYAYSTAAALVFNKIFFPQHDPLVGTILAFSGIAVGYLARPFGSAFFGHFGDRIGRKSVLVITLSIMGLTTFAIGLVPSYGQIGVIAPIILIALRLLQGIALGGEWGGAVLMSFEHGGRKKAGLMTSFPQAGMPLGLVLSTLCFLALSSLPKADFESWGWRVPFLASIVLVAVGIVIRAKVSETPAVTAMKEQHAVLRVPILQLFRTRTKTVLLAALVYVATGFYFFSTYTFALSYGTASVGLTYGTLLSATIVLAVVFFGMTIAAGALSDRFGRTKVMFVGFSLAVATPFPFFMMLSSGSLALVFIAFAMAGASIGLMYGPYAALMCESFEANVRFTGISLGLTFGVIIGAAFTSMLFAELFRITGSWAPIAICVMVSAIISAGAAHALSRNPVT
jgi:MFS family permease